MYILRLVRYMVVYLLKQWIGSSGMKNLCFCKWRTWIVIKYIAILLIISIKKTNFLSRYFMDWIIFEAFDLLCKYLTMCNAHRYSLEILQWHIQNYKISALSTVCNIEKFILYCAWLNPNRRCQSDYFNNRVATALHYYHNYQLNWILW